MVARTVSSGDYSQHQAANSDIAGTGNLARSRTRNSVASAADSVELGTPAAPRNGASTGSAGAAALVCDTAWRPPDWSVSLPVHSHQTRRHMAAGAERRSRQTLPPAPAALGDAAAFEIPCLPASRRDHWIHPPLSWPFPAGEGGGRPDAGGEMGAAGEQLGGQSIPQWDALETAPQNGLEQHERERDPAYLFLDGHDCPTAVTTAVREDTTVVREEMHLLLRVLVSTKRISYRKKQRALALFKALV